MHKIRLVAALAMSSAFLVPVAAQATGHGAHAPRAHISGTGAPTVAVSVAPFVKTATINVTLTTTPGGTSVVGYYLSESPATPLLTAAGWKSAKPSTFALSVGEGVKDIYAWVKGADATISASSHDTTLLDQTAPTVSMTHPDTSPTRAIAVALTGTDLIGAATAPAGITAWAVVAGSTAPAASDAAWKATRPTSFTLSAGNGVKTISAFSRDAAGNVSDPDTHTVTLAVPAPTVTVTMPAFTNKQTTALSLTRTDPGGTGIAAFFVSESSATPAAANPGWKPQPTSIILSALDGLKTVYAWVKDNNGTISAPSHASTLLDTVLPTVHLVAPASTTTRSVSVTVTGADDSSGVSRYAVVAGTTAPGAADTSWKAVPVTTFSLSLGNGSKTISAFSRDAAGNVSLASSQTLVMTLPAPTVSITMPAFTNKLVTPVVINTTDPGATGIAGFFVSEDSTAPTAGQAGWINKPTTFSLSVGDEVKTVYVWVKDNNGRVSAASHASTLLDTVLPTANLVAPDTTTTRSISVTVTGADDSSGVSRYAVVAGTTAPGATDAAWKAVPVTTFSLSLGNGSKTISAFSRDAAGNVSLASSQTLVMTLPAPTVTITMPTFTNKLATPVVINTTDPAGTGIAAFYVSEDSTAPTAGQAGWKPQPTTFTLASGDGLRTVYAWVKDNNGSVSAAGIATTLLDTVLPTVDLVAPDTTTTRSISVTVTGADDSSGVSRYAVVVGTTAPIASDASWKAVPVTTFSLSLGNGSKTISAFSRDAAGNVSLASSQTLVMTIPAPTVTITMPAFTNKLATPVVINTTDPGATGIAAFYVSQSPSTPTAGQAGWINKPTTFTLSVGDGHKTVHAWVKDNNGTVSSGAAAGTTLDTHVPTVSLVAPSSSPTKAISVTLGGTDVGTGITSWAVVAGTAVPNPADAAWKSVKPVTFTVSPVNGSKTISAFSRDAAGNVSLAASRTVLLVIPAPSLTLSVPAFTRTLSIPVTFTRSDPGATGIAGYIVSENPTTPAANDGRWLISPTSFTLSSGDGSKPLYAWVKDNNGSVSAAATAATVLDTVVPLVTFTTAATTTTAAHVIDVTVGGSDLLGSGVSRYALVLGTSVPGPADNAWKASAPLTFDLGLGATGVKTLTAFTRDAAGNVSVGVTQTVTILP